MTIVIGLDLSLTASGMAAMDVSTGKVVDTGLVEAQVKKINGMPRLEIIRKEVTDFVKKHTPRLVVIEGYAFAAKGRVVHLGELGGVIRLTMHKLGVTTLAVPPSTLKLFVTGSGKGGDEAKGRMMLSVYTKLGYEAKNNNVADAIGAAYMACAICGGPSSLVFTKAQKESLKKVEVVTDFR